MTDDRDTPRAAAGEGTHPDGIAWLYGALSEIPRMITEALTSLQKIATEYGGVTPEDYQSTLTGIADTIAKTMQKLLSENPIFAENEKAIAAFAESQQGNIPEELKPIAPYLLAELKADPDHADTPIEEAYRAGTDERGNLTDSPYREQIRRAQERAEIDAAMHRAVSAMQILEQTANAIGNIDASATGKETTEKGPRMLLTMSDRLSYPIDKPNSRIWNLLSSSKPNGQLSFDIETTSPEDKRQGKEALIVYNLNFDELENVRITKQLTPFDKRVYIAVAALYKAGNGIINLYQIHQMMGNKGNPSQGQMDKINESLTKMRGARVYVDNTKEIEINKRYPKFKYDGALLEFRRISAYNRNNELSDASIMILAYPPLMSFAEQRNQLTTIPRYVLESPASKTDANLMLDDYLLERISHMKHDPKLSRKILFSKVYERCQITTKMQKSRAPERIKRYLDYYAKVGFISGYTEAEDGITINL